MTGDPSDEQLRRAVDEVLEPVWGTEHRRAAARLAFRSAGRWAGGMGAVALLDALLFLAAGVALPVSFFVVIGLVAAVAAAPDDDQRSHLRRWPRPPRPRLYLLPRT